MPARAVRPRDDLLTSSYDTSRRQSARSVEADTRYVVDHTVYAEPLTTAEVLQCRLVDDRQLMGLLGPRGAGSQAPLQLRARETGGPSSGDLLTPKIGAGGGGGGAGAWGDGVQAKMERAFSADFSKVQLHTNSAEPAKVGALAFASGDDIHFSPGSYAPGTPGAESLLGHELAHVVQQREGRVAADTQLAGGVGVNTSRALEAEADDWGARAARGEVVRGPAASRGGASGGVVQRKIGLEMQSNWLILSIDGAATDSKDIAYRGYYFDIEVDAGDGRPELEIVTRPLRDRAAVEAAIAEITMVVVEMSQEGRRDITLSGGGWVGEVVIRRSSREPVFRLQYTEGVTLENIPSLIRDRYPEAYGALPKDVKGAADAPEAEGAALMGLRAAIDMFLGDALGYKPRRGSDGPKYVFPLMARSDFYAMYQNLSAEEQVEFQAMIGMGKEKATHFHGFDLEQPVFPGIDDCPTIREWLRSMVEGRPASILRRGGVDEDPDHNQEKDLMSPPPGYDPHDAVDQHNARHPDRPLMKYAMGMYGLDDEGLALFEDRAAGSALGENLQGTLSRVDRILESVGSRDPRFAGEEEEAKGRRRRKKARTLPRAPGRYQPSEEQAAHLDAHNLALEPIAPNGFCIFASIGAVTGRGGVEVQRRVLHALREGHVDGGVRGIIEGAGFTVEGVRHAVANIYDAWDSDEADIIPEIAAVVMGVGLDIVQPAGNVLQINGGGDATLVRVTRPLAHYHATRPTG